MEIVKQLATARGIAGFSLKGIILPVDVALDDDQMCPVLVASASNTFQRSALFGAGALFPWTIRRGDSGVALIDGDLETCRAEGSIVPESVGLCFIDYEVERAWRSAQLDDTQNPDALIVSLDYMADSLTLTADETEKSYERPHTFTTSL